MLVLYVYAVAWINFTFLFCAFLYKNLFVLILFLTFAIDLASPKGQGGSRHRGLLLPLPYKRLHTSLRHEALKDVFKRYLLPYQTSQIWLCTKKIPQQSVHVGCIILVCLLSNYWLAAYIIHNTQWRGLAKLLISVHRQCEGLIWWGKRRMFPHVFLFPLFK